MEPRLSPYWPGRLLRAMQGSGMIFSVFEGITELAVQRMVRRWAARKAGRPVSQGEKGTTCGCQDLRLGWTTHLFPAGSLRPEGLGVRAAGVPCCPPSPSSPLCVMAAPLWGSEVQILRGAQSSAWPRSAPHHVSNEDHFLCRTSPKALWPGLEHTCSALLAQHRPPISTPTFLPGLSSLHGGLASGSDAGVPPPLLAWFAESEAPGRTPASGARKACRGAQGRVDARG